MLMPRLALFQPDIPQNAGTVIRMCACLGVPVDIIEPCGFDASDRNFRRAGMDYLERAAVTRHGSWAMFEEWRAARAVADGAARLVIVETDGATAHHDFAFRKGDILVLGRESAGLPAHVRTASEFSVVIPQVQGVRSLNVATAAAIVLGEALRQLGAWPQGGALGPEQGIGT